ncbi:MAG: hypothetical protein WCN87_04020, partial [Chlamydiota bacterium]
MNPLSASVPLFVIPSLPEVYTSSKKHSFKVIENSPITQITALFFYRKTVPQLLTPSLSGSFPVGHTSFVVKGPKNLIGIDIYSPTQKVKGAELLEYTLYPGHPFSPTAKRFTTQSFENLCPIEDK